MPGVAAQGGRGHWLAPSGGTTVREPSPAPGPVAAPPPPPPGPAAAGARDDSDNLIRRPRDDLTGLLDRPAGFAAVRCRIERARQLGEPVVIGYLDVNAMRRVNDTRGIRAGDELLRSVAGSLCTVACQHDVVARVGGDRFILAMVGVDTRQARERFLSFVVSPEEASPPSRIIRIGFAELRGGDTVKDLVARAEAAMAKPPV